MYMVVHEDQLDRKSTRLNSSHLVISYAVFCLKKKIKAPPAAYAQHRGNRHRSAPTPTHQQRALSRARLSAVSCECGLSLCVFFFFFLRRPAHHNLPPLPPPPPLPA